MSRISYVCYYVRYYHGGAFRPASRSGRRSRPPMSSDISQEIQASAEDRKPTWLGTGRSN
ncbi:hypothetical protein ACNONS_03525 [Bacteroides xylanisolvens]|uniref:hypothetical protein n=1 Tax=Bacteroides TaxID=816 RepID=UPI0035153460